VHGAAEALAEASKHERVFVIGGASVYLEMFPHLDRFFVTKIDCAPHSDAFFPDLDNDPNGRSPTSAPRRRRTASATAS
jgi:dihydrofolate reductase